MFHSLQIFDFGENLPSTTLEERQVVLGFKKNAAKRIFCCTKHNLLFADANKIVLQKRVDISIEISRIIE